MSPTSLAVGTVSMTSWRLERRRACGTNFESSTTEPGGVVPPVRGRLWQCPAQHVAPRARWSTSSTIPVSAGEYRGRCRLRGHRRRVRLRPRAKPVGSTSALARDS